MADPPPTPSVSRADDPHARRLARAQLAIPVLLGLLGIVSAIALGDGVTPLAALQAAAVVALALAFLLHRYAVAELQQRRDTRDSSFARILQGLSRSVSPESVVEAIVQELRSASGADHVVVARVRRPDDVVEVTLVSASASAAASRTSLRPDVLGVPSAGGRSPTSAPATPGDAAEEIARRIRSAYGLPFTLAEPLVADGRFAGALILSRRTRGAWSDADQRLLGWAAGEVSAAFARTYAHEEAETRANIDALTGLPNRRYFDELVSVVGPRRRAGDTLGVLMIDIDHFKRLNDRYGHATGDRVLRAVGAAIASAVRADDTPARYGGEEFVVMVRNADPGHVAEVAERIRLAVREMPLEPLRVEEPVTVSVGAAVAAGDVPVASLIERADAALYAAKRRGRDRAIVSSPG